MRDIFAMEIDKDETCRTCFFLDSLDVTEYYIRFVCFRNTTPDYDGEVCENYNKYRSRKG